MNSRVLALIAGILVLAASILGYLGYQSTADARQAAQEAEARAAAATAVASGQPVVVLTRDISAYSALTADDVIIDRLQTRPSEAFESVDQVLGLPPQTDLSAGTVLLKSHLSPGGDLARLLRAGERAVAIPVDAVVGGGGFVQPGDLVDILLFLEGDDGKPQSAQVVMRNMRVLSYGDTLVKPPGKTASTASPAEEGAPPAGAAQREGARTAVLAVAREDVTRLLLASNLGALRLAIVPTAELVAPEAIARADIQPLPAVEAIPHASKASAVPDQRQFLTSNFLQPGTSSAKPRAPASGGVRIRGNADEAVVIYRGLSAEVAP